MSQLYSSALSYLYSSANRHLGILTVTYDSTTTDISSTNVSVQLIGNAYSVTIVFDLSSVYLPSVDINRLRYFAYNNNELLYHFDISVTGITVPRGTYVVSVTIVVVDDQVNWMLTG